MIVGNWKAVDSHKKRTVEAGTGRNITQQLKMATPQAFPGMGEMPRGTRIGSNSAT